MRKIAYLALMGATVYLCIMYDGSASMYLLGFEILLLFFLYISSWYLKAHLRLHLDIQIPVVEKEQEFPVEIWVENTGWLPIPLVRIHLSYDSDYSRKVGKTVLSAGAGPKKKERQKKNFAMKYAGRYYFYTPSIRVYDFLRIFSKKVVCSDTTFVNVLPTIRELPLEIDPRTRQYMPDSDEYASDRSGDDVSEIYALRDYRPGDSMKTIHWKLSARMDHWMVKEFSYPQGVQILLLLDLFTLNVRVYGEEAMDRLLGNFASLSFTLSQKGVSHVAAWYDDESGELKRSLISNEEGTYAMVDQLLEAVPYATNYDVETGYAKEYPGETFAATLVLNTEQTLRKGEEVLEHFGEEGHEQQVII